VAVCGAPGCPAIIPDGSTYCEADRKKTSRESRARYPRQRKGAGWERISKRYLRAHPDCECTDPECGVCHGEGCGLPATEVDHIVPREAFTDLRVAHEDRNLQALSKPCHSSKTAREVGFAGAQRQGEPA
jgi:5-methylcytosine-specific restriction protein A